MLHNPFLLLDRKPQPENKKRDNTQDEPSDVFTEKLNTFTVKHDLFTIDFRVFCNPTLNHTFRPRRTDE